MIKVLSILLVSLLPIISFSQSDNSLDLRLVDKINFDFSTQVLSNPIKILSYNDLFFWITEKSIKAIDHRGNVIYEYEKLGRGPGEFEYIKDVNILNNRLHVFDNSLKKIMIFNIDRNGLEYISEENFKVSNSRKFTIDIQGNYYFLHSHNYLSSLSAVSKFDKKGNLLTEFGITPELAALGRGLRGGGITYLQNNSGIYYSYLGDPTLYKIEEKRTNVIELLDQPSYFKIANEQKVKSNNSNLHELILIAYENTRIVDVLGYDGFVIQVVENGGPRMEGPTQYFLEVWCSDEKRASKLKIPSKQVFSDGDFIYTLSGYESDLLKDDSREKNLFNKYEFTHN